MGMMLAGLSPVFEWDGGTLSFSIGWFIGIAIVLVVLAAAARGNL